LLVTPCELGIGSDHLGICHDELLVTPGELGIGSDHLGISHDELRVTPGELGIGSDHLGISHDELLVTPGELGIVSDELGIGPDELPQLAGHIKKEKLLLQESQGRNLGVGEGGEEGLCPAVLLFGLYIAMAGQRNNKASYQC